MGDTPQPFPEALRKRVLEVGNLCILAGCTAEEIIAACRAEVERWALEHRP